LHSLVGWSELNKKNFFRNSFVFCSFGWPENNTDDRYLVGHERLPLGLRLGLSFYPLVYESVSSGIQSSGNLKMSGNEDHHRQGRRFAAGGNGHDGRDSRDVEIESLRQRVRELEINPFDRYERQYEDTPTDTAVEEYENEGSEFEISFHQRHPRQPTPLQRHRRPSSAPPQTDPIRSLGIRTEIQEFEGRLCPDDFLDWLRTVGRIFDLRDTLIISSHAPQSATCPVRVGPIKADPPALTGVSPTPTTSSLRCFKCQGIGHLKRECPNKEVPTLIDEADPLYDTEDEVETEVVYPDRG
nr:reverse transcriptase domain-containing protein [Tanacetum cinerariifolium]